MTFDKFKEAVIGKMFSMSKTGRYDPSYIILEVRPSDAYSLPIDKTFWAYVVYLTIAENNNSIPTFNIHRERFNIPLRDELNLDYWHLIDEKEAMDRFYMTLSNLNALLVQSDFLKDGLL